MMKLIDCQCGIDGRYNPVMSDSPFRENPYPILTCCLFFGEVVVAANGVRAMKAEIETIWLFSDVLKRMLGGLLSESTLGRVCEECAYQLSARYSIPVRIIADEDVKSLPKYKVASDVPSQYVIGYYRTLAPDVADEEYEGGGYTLTLEANSRLARSLQYALTKDDGVVRTAELRGLHCKRWQDCIHGYSGYATFIQKTVSAYGLFERVKRGKFRITQAGRELATNGSVTVKMSYLDYLTKRLGSRDQRFLSREEES